jgi:hypothetical protein
MRTARRANIETVAFRAVSQLLWSKKVREKWFPLRENHERFFRFDLNQLRNRLNGLRFVAGILL